MSPHHSHSWERDGKLTHPEIREAINTARDYKDDETPLGEMSRAVLAMEQMLQETLRGEADAHKRNRQLCRWLGRETIPDGWQERCPRCNAMVTFIGLPVEIHIEK